MDQILPSGQTVTLVHFEHEGRIACIPNMVELHTTRNHLSYQRTDDPRAVSCPACKKTGVHQGALGQIESLVRSGARAK